MRHLLSIISLMIFATLATNACECIGNSPFTTSASFADYVALVKIKKYLSFNDIYGQKTPMSMEVEILENIRGTETRKTITVWGDPGHLCRPYLSIFQLNTYYVIAFNECKGNQTYNEEKDSDYYISNCGTYWLLFDFEKGVAKGHFKTVTKVDENVSLKELKSYVPTYEYSNMKFRFAAQIPYTWALYRDHESDTAFIASWSMPVTYSEIEKTNIVNAVSVRAIKSRDIISIAKLEEAELSRINNTLVSKTLLSSGNEISYLVNNKIDGISYKTKFYLLFNEGIGYVITFTATEGTYDVNLGKFESFVHQFSTFKWQ